MIRNGFKIWRTATWVAALAWAVTACSDDAGGGTADVGPDTSVDLVEDVVEDVATDTRTEPRPDTALPPIICRPCRSSADCQLPGNACINLPSGESVCGIDCSRDEAICPADTFCATVGADGPVRQCVPEALFCNNQCGDPPRECEDEGEICDPLTGLCNPPLGLCDPCAIDEQCGADNLCLTFPDIDNSRACGQECSGGAVCPGGFVCAVVSEDGTERQCVPETLTCIDRCSGTICADGQICDPLTGGCTTPLGLCDECITNAQCGGANLCLALLDGNAYCGLDCGLTAEIPGDCPVGFVCQNLSQTVSQCVPTLLTCVNHCEEPRAVECDEGFNCDPVDGTCHASTVGICGRPCENNFECGGQDDLCVAIEGGLGAAICAADCSDGSPCPIGYSCFPLTDGASQQCAPSDIDEACDLCADVACPQGEACRPVDGTCLPLPSPCLDTAGCATDEVCNSFEGRCEPVGLSCRHSEFFDCPWDTSCSATSLEMEGVCLQECSARPEGCPDWAPACESFYRIFIGVCVERGLGGPESCGRYADTRIEVGRPCPFSEDSDSCGLTADLCLTDVAPGIPGFCSMTCDPTAEDPCPVGGSCRQLPGGVISYCLPDDCGCLAVPDLELGEEDVVQTALDGLALTRCDIAYNQAERDSGGQLVANDPFRTRLVGEIRNEALTAVDALRAQRPAASSAALSPALAVAAANLGYELSGTPVEPGETTFCEAVQALWSASPDEPPTCEELAATAAAIPAELLGDIIAALVAAEAAATQRDAVFREVTTDELETVIDGAHRLLLDDGGPPFDAYDHRALLLGLKLDLLYDEGLALAAALERLPLELDRGGGAIDLAVRLQTPRGLVLVNGDDDHTYCNDATECEGLENGQLVDEAVLLLIDTGGDDTYLIPAGANADLDHPVALVFDLGGDDLYSYTGADVGAGDLLPADAQGRAEPPAEPVSLSTVGRQGSGRGGYAFLFDRGLGADTYESLRMSQGYGLLGVGALVDDGCDGAGDANCPDIYRAESLSQGAGLFGIGVLMTGDGPTDALGWHLVQGAGGPLGSGLVVDLSGDDIWTVEPGDGDSTLFPSPFLRSRGNWSLGQGCGVGVPSELPETGGNLSGGVGVLVDLDGDDVYTAGIMGQAAGFRHGLGMLLDAGGADVYEVHAYGQGVGVDYGVGAFGEAGGDDVYNPDEDDDPRVLGSGDNFGVGLALEEAGADQYEAGSQSLGGGFFNGSGVFVDNDGNDTYTLDSEETLGKATLTILGSEPPNNPRRTARTVGLFVDAGGIDSYTGRSLEGIGNDASWVQQTPGAGGEGLLEYGVGADRVGGTGLTTE